jgi:hypothetical protein
MYKGKQFMGGGNWRMRKMYLPDVSLNVSHDAMFSFTGTGPVSFGICAKPREFS